MKERGLLERLTNSNGELAFYSYLLRDVRQRARPGPHCRISQVDTAFVEPLKFELFSLHSDHSHGPDSRSPSPFCFHLIIFMHLSSSVFSFKTRPWAWQTCSLLQFLCRHIQTKQVIVRYVCDTNNVQPNGPLHHHQRHIQSSSYGGESDYRASRVG